MKRKIRDSIKVQRKVLTAKGKENKDLKVKEKLQKLITNSDATKIALYKSLPEEVDTSAIITVLLESGYQVALPKIVNKEIEFYQITPGMKLQKNALGIEEPLPQTLMEDPEIIVVPVVAFDRKGNRIGYGAGHYDKFLSKLPDSYKIGIAYSFQEVDAIIPEIHDVPLDVIVTENRIYKKCTQYVSY